MTDRAFTAVHLFLLSAIAAVSVSLFYQGVTARVGMPEAQGRGGGIVSTGPAVQQERKPLSFYEDILTRNLFDLVVPGKDDKPQPAAIDVESLSETRLRLKLWGTISGGGDAVTRAIIEDEVTRKQDLFKVGDRVQEAVIKLVLRDRVVVSYKGRDEVLMMETAKGAGQSIRNGASGRNGRNLPPASITKKVNLRRDTIDDAMMNISSLMKDVRIKPHFRNGQPEGMAISGIKSDSIFRKMGIRNGDVIMGVDGQKIESVDDAMSLYGNLKSASEVKIEIKRMGQIQTIEYTIE
ncbi:type II secretion system protein GspC [Desulfoluna butyratoxydans]|uniref:Type ii secretion system protein c n-terminal n=1 Tax=Desulfoluna butyratoxydans TaxID=231438 RepID=A0A4V6ILT9_9BACT|nr:type II secretion system protein GspC [Desulfoluna butyratoxydans]VFQ46348.1 type ii secretion system protein c n-terminal [Desulfoluna butyratoxydans]